MIYISTFNSLTVAISFAVIATTFAGPHDPHTKSELNCFVSHLKATNQLAADWPLFTSTDELLDCAEVVTKFTNLINQGKADDLKTIYPDKADCFIDGYKSRNFADLKIKLLIISRSETLGNIAKQRDGAPVTLAIEKIEEDVANICDPEPLT